MDEKAAHIIPSWGSTGSKAHYSSVLYVRQVLRVKWRWRLIQRSIEWELSSLSLEIKLLTGSHFTHYPKFICFNFTVYSRAHQTTLSLRFKVETTYLSAVFGGFPLCCWGQICHWYDTEAAACIWCSQRNGITVYMLYYAVCWHQTDLQSSFIIHGHRLSASRSTKWPRGPERKTEKKSELDIAEGLTHHCKHLDRELFGDADQVRDTETESDVLLHKRKEMIMMTSNIWELISFNDPVSWLEPEAG